MTRKGPTSKSPRIKREASSTSGQLMYVKCSACGSWMDVKPGGMNQVSHGLCEDCFRNEMKKLDTMETDERMKR